ncbi:putative fluoride ion transporter CrcB 1 [Actinoplanes italicus]|uniref:Fluoride-specific ion channel FluC n=1 Tax=Actinoplanes italicus TaxID=113567 RepID=A0A2T0JX27_9ACTN|nr:CrcB family protein [Actinoplanes italicus]PRX12442.1 CrcB protein [Actinoplanes italicus]GIE35561.1 putative fluoride ion transporter CrcB 1 [Actinoplanes italicus]
MDLDVKRADLAAVAAGGVLGALARYGIGTVYPYTQGDFPWSTWVINVSGCFLIGVLNTRVQRRLPRLLLGTGFLGGYTTFSTAIVEVSQAGLIYLATTLIGAVVAVTAGSLLAR